MQIFCLLHPKFQFPNNALKKSLNVSGEIGSMVIVVDPIDQRAVEFYERFGFIMLPDSTKMFLPMKTISLLFKADNK